MRSNGSVFFAKVEEGIRQSDAGETAPHVEAVCQHPKEDDWWHRVGAQPREMEGALLGWWSEHGWAEMTGPTLHRPLLLVPRHLPEHPLVPGADDEGFLHPPFFLSTGSLGPLINLLSHPQLHLSELWRRIEH